MKNSQVAETFVNRRVWKEEKVEGSNFFIEGNVVYSYGHHFPLAIRLENNIFLLNGNGYSKTTGKHKGVVRREIEKQGFKYYVLTTDELKAIIDKGFTNIKEVMLNNMLKDCKGVKE